MMHFFILFAYFKKKLYLCVLKCKYKQKIKNQCALMRAQFV